MTRQEIIRQLKVCFDIRELVCPHCYKVWGEKSWLYLSTPYLHTLLLLRTKILKVPMIMNDYLFGGINTQRGLRCNLCQTVKNKSYDNVLYVSAHCHGKGGDAVFGIKTGMTAEKARQLIKQYQDLLPFNIRIEGSVTWLHFDVYDKGVKVYEF